ncbi:HNH endonuclease [Brevibacillus laterosporus]|uniref:HNH endonuclease n=1 Tax=Brevibacillus laterosporus TaxID=1465 RepID=UPI0018F86F4E|nr:HNH endonuclease [Brevibacillus laterosporus]MBG9776228.1 hypothetical protein [Brevibacillus laterosporus]
MATNFQIFEYWKNKSINGDLIVYDVGEPSCWACHKPILVERDDVKEDLKAIWNRTSGKLQRCHIIAASLGGSNIPSNLFLMCESCHQLAPDTLNKESFFMWVEYRRSQCILGIEVFKMISEMETICTNLGLDFKEVQGFIGENGLKLLKECKEEITTHGAKIAHSSIIMIFIQKFLEQNNSVRNSSEKLINNYNI